MSISYHRTRSKENFMITYKNYVHYNTVDTKEDVINFFKGDDIYSNREDYEIVVERLVAYKESRLRNYGKNPDKKAYRNIWAHEMIVLLPYEFHDEEKAQEFVKEYMIQIHSCYKTNNYLYCFKLFKQGKGMYADIICFTRKYYNRKQINMEIWNQDYYWNPVTKKRCKKDHPDAVLLHKKGDPKLDNKGNVVVNEIYVAPVEKKIFKYSNFDINKLTSWLRSIISDVKLTLLRTVSKLFEVSKKYISCPKRVENDKYKIARRCLKSSLINEINTELSIRYEHMILGRLTDGESYIDYKGNYHSGYDENIRSFNKLIHKIDKLVNKTDIEWIDITGTKILIYLGSKQTFSDFRKELNKLKEYVLYLINEWWEVNIL